MSFPVIVINVAFHSIKEFQSGIAWIVVYLIVLYWFKETFDPGDIRRSSFSIRWHFVLIILEVVDPSEAGILRALIQVKNLWLAMSHINVF